MKESYEDRKGLKKQVHVWKQVQKSCYVPQLIQEITTTMTTHIGHIFRAYYQYQMQTKMAKELPLDHCMVTMDFAENYSVQMQDEIESAHWTQKQITIRPMFIVRHAPESTPDKPVTMKESLIILTDNLNHNTHAVYVFTNQLLKHIRNNPGPCDMKVLRRWTDNCAVQYKCVKAFHQIRELERENDIKIVYHYTEASHGKSQFDGLGGAIKKRLDRAILSGQVVNTKHIYCVIAKSFKQGQCQRSVTNTRLPTHRCRKENGTGKMQGTEVTQRHSAIPQSTILSVNSYYSV